MEGFKKLKVYQLAYQQAMEIFNISEHFPRVERYALTDQIRRSSRSVCANLAEGYKKRIYKKMFVAKCADSHQENSETNVWIDFAHDCGYIDLETKKKLVDINDQIGRLLYHMIHNPDKYL